MPFIAFIPIPADFCIPEPIPEKIPSKGFAIVDTLSVKFPIVFDADLMCFFKLLLIFELDLETFSPTAANFSHTAIPLSLNLVEIASKAEATSPPYESMDFPKPLKVLFSLFTPLVAFWVSESTLIFFSLLPIPEIELAV